MILAQYISQLQSDFGFSLGSQTDTSVTSLLVNNEFNVYLQEETNQQQIFLFSQFKELPHNQEKLEKILHELLCANFLLEETDGSIFSVNDERGWVILFKKVEISELEYPELQKIFFDFVETFKMWRIKIDSILDKEETIEIPDLKNSNYIKI